MRGAALQMARRLPPLKDVDLIMATNMLSLADMRALLPPGHPPLLVYFHENQFSYPLAPGESMDYQFGFTDITTALAAERVLFNSRTHRDSFFSKLPGFLKMMPEYRPNWAVEAIRSKARVLYPGCRFPAPRARRRWSAAAVSILPGS